jgi:peptidoglycan/xylan/chitin deacetylase (PgdA/CDA1 family)
VVSGTARRWAAMACAVSAGALLAFATPARAAQTVVTIQFDDGRNESAARAILARHHIHATFFLNTGQIGMPGYFTWRQVRGLAADGNEIGGHTLTHRDLPTLSKAEQRREICGDRTALIAHGYKPTNFAYPFGSYTAATERVVQSCGYSSGRAAWGLWMSGCEEEPATCPYAIDLANPGDLFAMPVADAPIDLTYVENQRNVVRNAQAHGGGWVQIFWHQICPDDCDEYSWSPDSLDTFLGWLEQQRAAGTVAIKTSQEVLGLPFHPGVKPPKPPAPPHGANRLRNPSLTHRAKGSDAPACWEQQGSATWSRRHGTQVAKLSGAPDGFAALAVPQDQGECSPAVRPGERLVLSARYRSLDHPRFVVWTRTKAGGWAFWRNGPALAPARRFRRAALRLPRVPKGVAALSVGIALNGNGKLAIDRLALVR